MTRPARGTQGDILEDIALIENLEETKRTALEIADKVVQAKETGMSLSQAREVRAPRPAPRLAGSRAHSTPQLTQFGRCTGRWRRAARCCTSSSTR